MCKIVISNVKDACIIYPSSVPTWTNFHSYVKLNISRNLNKTQILWTHGNYITNMAISSAQITWSHVSLGVNIVCYFIQKTYCHQNDLYYFLPSVEQIPCSGSHLNHDIQLFPFDQFLIEILQYCHVCGEHTVSCIIQGPSVSTA